MARHYLFADESGNLDFSNGRGATRFFAIATVELAGDAELDALRYDLLRLRTELGWRAVGEGGGFHASEDPQAVRDQVFAVLSRHNLVADVTLFEKAKAQPHLYRTDDAFFRYAWQAHLGRVVPDRFAVGSDVMLSVAAIGTRKTRAQLRGAVHDVVAGAAPKCAVRTLFVPAEGDPALQAADYALWAVMRSTDRGDQRALDAIGITVRSLADHFAHGRVRYY